MHGGLFSDDTVTLDDIRKVERNKQPPETGKSKHSIRSEKLFCHGRSIAIVLIFISKYHYA